MRASKLIADEFDRLTDAERADFDEFMATTKGLPAWRLAWAMNSLTPGTDWRRCPKSMVGVRWAQRNRYHSRHFKGQPISQVAKAVADVLLKHPL